MVCQTSGITQVAIGSIVEILRSEGSARSIQGNDYKSQLSDCLSPPEYLVYPKKDPLGRI